MRSFVFLALFAFAVAQQTASTAYFCEVAVPNFCSGSNDPCPAPPSFSSNPSGPLFARSTVNEIAFSEFNVISFWDFNAAADTEGRVATARRFSVADGYSVGALVWTDGPGATDREQPYSLIVGGDLIKWNSGALYPQSSNNFYAASEEYMFVGGSNNAVNYLQQQALDDATLKQTVAQDFADGQIYYTNLQAAFAAVPQNVQWTVASNGDFKVTCPAGAAGYSLNIDQASFNNIRTYVFDKTCNSNVQLVINVQGSGTVTFSGNNIPAPWRAEAILFNILGSGRTITVSGASVVGNILAPQNTLYTTNGGYIQGFQVYGTVQMANQLNRVYCQPPAPPVHPTDEKLCPGFEANCAGLDITLPAPADQTAFSFRDCNVVSFMDFVADTGDVEGRVCAARDFIVGKGYSVGYELSTLNNLPDRHAPASLIAGRDCYWPSGSIYPAGNNIPYPGLAEGAYCGRTFNGSADLQARVIGSCGTAGCLDAQFTAAYGCYKGYSTQLAQLTPNVDVRVQFSALFLTCKDITATQYVFSITPDTMSQYTYIVTDNCNFQAYWVMNVVGSGDVLFTGAFLAVPNGATVVNVVGARTVSVTGIQLNAHLLAVDATLNQTGGVIIGKVVAGNIVHALQINHQNTCPDITIVQVPIVPQPPNTPPTPVIPPTPVSSSGDVSSSSGASVSSSSGSASSSGSVQSSSSTGTDVPVTPTGPGCIPVTTPTNFRPNDVITLFANAGNETAIIDSMNGNVMCVNPPDAVDNTGIFARQVGFAAIRSSNGRMAVANPAPVSSASAAGVAVALFALIALLI